MLVNTSHLWYNGSQPNGGYHVQIQENKAKRKKNLFAPQSLDAGSWGNTAGLCYPPYQRELEGQQVSELGDDDERSSSRNARQGQDWESEQSEEVLQDARYLEQGFEVWENGRFQESIKEA